MMTNGHHSSFGCHIAVSDVAPGFHVNKINERGGCADSPNVDGDDIVCLHHGHREGEGQGGDGGRRGRVGKNQML